MALKIVGLEIKNLIDEEECYKQVRQLRWPESVFVRIASQWILSSEEKTTQNLAVNVMSAMVVANVLMI